MKDEPDALPADIPGVIKRLFGSRHAMMGSKTPYHHIAKSYQDCDIVILPESLYKANMGVGLPKESPFEPRFSHV